MVTSSTDEEVNLTSGEIARVRNYDEFNGAIDVVGMSTAAQKTSGPGTSRIWGVTPGGVRTATQRTSGPSTSHIRGGTPGGVRTAAQRTSGPRTSRTRVVTPVGVSTAAQRTSGPSTSHIRVELLLVCELLHRGPQDQARLVFGV
jgi:hypothetical protein